MNYSFPMIIVRTLTSRSVVFGADTAKELVRLAFEDSACKDLKPENDSVEAALEYFRDDTMSFDYLETKEEITKFLNDKRNSITTCNKVAEWERILDIL